MSYKILIGSGWWCSEKNERSNARGASLNREKEFFDIWLESLYKQEIDFDVLVIDSNSPIKPNYNNRDKRLKFLSLDENAGHAINHKGQFCGWTRSVLMSMTYCLCGSYDYFVYIEQDALLHGNVIREAIEVADKGDKGIAFGYSRQTAYPVQVSLFVIRKDRIMNFLSKIYSINKRDGELSPENKFGLVSSILAIPGMLKLFCLSDRVTSKLVRILFKVPFIRRFNYFNFGFGRERPISFDNETYYFQQGEAWEIEEYLRRIS